MSRQRSAKSLPEDSKSSASNRNLPIYASDEVIAKVLFGTERGDFDWKTLFRQLERDGFPPKRTIFGGRRHLPAVIAFCAKREMGELDPPLGLAREPAPEDGPEEFD
jgi:hypothetical protein